LLGVLLPWCQEEFFYARKSSHWLEPPDLEYILSPPVLPPPSQQQQAARGNQAGWDSSLLLKRGATSEAGIL